MHKQTGISISLNEKILHGFGLLYRYLRLAFNVHMHVRTYPLYMFYTYTVYTIILYTYTYTMSKERLCTTALKPLAFYAKCINTIISNSMYLNTYIAFNSVLYYARLSLLFFNFIYMCCI